MKLTDAEWDALSHLARLSKMDCWFELRGNEKHDWVYDAENRVALGLRNAVGMVFEGLVWEDVHLLSEAEQRALCGLRNRL